MSRLLLLLCCFTLSLSVAAQKNPPAYQLFDRKGKTTNYRKLLRQVKEADVVLFGESHNDPIAHWLQNVLARDLAEMGSLTVGMEMFESDQQEGLDAYLAGTMKAEEVDKIGEGLWPNFATDYKPLVDWAAQLGVPVIATNVPRPYARLVFRQGLAALDTLPAAEKALLPPLPIPYDPELPGYQAMLEMMPAGHGGETFPMAQAIKDATMAHFIARNQNADRFLHLNGSYHSDNDEGIGWYLRRYAPELRILTITTVEEGDVSELSADNRGKADFTLAVPALMTKTY